MQKVFGLRGLFRQSLHEVSDVDTNKSIFRGEMAKRMRRERGKRKMLGGPGHTNTRTCGGGSALALSYIYPLAAVRQVG